MPRPSNWTADLVFGWRVNDELEPEYWLRPNARLGAQRLSDLITVRAAAAAHHTAIVGQSGSGRSYFLGRIVEEIALKTQSRILIFDQSTSFRGIADVKSSELWTSAQYDRKTKRGFLPDESSRSAFATQWNRITKTVYSKMAEQLRQFSPLQLSLESLPIEILFDEFGNQLTEFKHCHSFVQCVVDLVILTKPREFRARIGVFEIAHRLIAMTAGMSRDEIVTLLLKDFPSNKGEIRSAPLYQRAAAHRSFVSNETARVYFSMLLTIFEDGLLPASLPSSREQQAKPRIRVFDVPSIFSDSLQTVAISGFLNEEWQAARRQWQEAAILQSASRSRVPLFVVVEEAHSVIPAQPSNRAEAKLRDQFRDIAADGPKFGVYLILMSHRPDRLDPLVLSDCENRAIMKLTSSLAVQTASELLGLDDTVRRAATRATSFAPGRALMCGPWAENGLTYLLSAARRTNEGAFDWQTLPEKTAKRKSRGTKKPIVRLTSITATEIARTKEPTAMTPSGSTKFQCFVSYASEDRDFVQQLVGALSARKISVWWDRGQITLGDRLSVKIDEGLSQSRYGLVIVSSSFVKKQWTNAEIRSLLNRAVGRGQKVILPVLVGMSHSQFADTYPLLADIVSTTYSGDIDELVVEIMQAIA